MATKEVKAVERGEARGGMRTGAIVIGIIAGLAALVSAVLALMVGGVGAAVEPEGASQVIGLGWSALGLSLLGLIGAALWIAKPQLAPLIMATAGVAIVFSISMFAVIARPLFLVAALLGRVRQEAQRPPRTKEAPSCESPSL
jgi:hypothetical protein